MPARSASSFLTKLKNVRICTLTYHPYFFFRYTIKPHQIRFINFRNYHNPIRLLATNLLKPPHSAREYRFLPICLNFKYSTFRSTKTKGLPSLFLRSIPGARTSLFSFTFCVDPRNFPSDYTISNQMGGSRTLKYRSVILSQQRATTGDILLGTL